MRHALAISILTLAVYGVYPASRVVAADSKGAITDLRKVDADYAYQGEYCGRALIELPSRSCVWRNVGLQVIALGNGNFDGVLYQGGLPGAGWWKGDPKWKFNGSLTDGVVTLKAENGQSITVDGHGGHIMDPPDSPLDEIGRVAKVHRSSPTLGMSPPSGSVVLFDGTDTGKLDNVSITEDGYLQIVPGSRKEIYTKDAYRDFTLHLEFRLPYMPHARGQGRSNSGVYLQQRYETQILDSFGLEGVHNECGGLYRQREPDVNMCLPPLTWQTYDIQFRAARFDGKSDKPVQLARLTVRHNGVVIHNDYELTGKTGAGKQEAPEALPTKLQNHGNPVFFRNIWLVEGTTGSACPVACKCKATKKGLLSRLFGN